MDASQAEVRYGEGSPESEIHHPVVEQAQAAFDAAQNEVAPQSVYEAHREAFQKVLSQVPEDQRGSLGVRTADVWNKVTGRIDDVSSRLIDGVKDYNPFAIAYRAVGKLRGVDVSMGQHEETRKANVRGAAEVQTERMKQQIDTQKTFQEIVPGGKVLNIVNKIFGPRFK